MSDNWKPASKAHLMRQWKPVRGPNSAAEKEVDRIYGKHGGNPPPTYKENMQRRKKQLDET